MKNRLIEYKQTMQIVVDAELHKQLKILSAKRRASIRELVEQALIEVYDFISLSKENDD